MNKIVEFLKKRKGEIGLTLLIIYSITLGIATADEIFDLGIFPTKLEKMIAQSIEKLKSNDKQIQEQAMKELEEYGDFAVPQLIKAIDNENIRPLVLETLKKVAGKDLGNDPNAWKEWYKRHKDEF